MFSSATLSRLGGARPLEEAITMDANYRNTLYSAKDATRQERLGEAVRSKLLSGTAPTADEIGDFANQYAAAGGQIGHFGTTMTKWAQEATTSVANKVFNHLSTPRNQVAMVQMGGQPLPDYRNAGNIGVASASSASARQPVANLPGARQAPDGAHYVPDPSNPGKYLRLDAP
jgi:hypothetical protein